MKAGILPHLRIMSQYLFTSFKTFLKQNFICSSFERILVQYLFHSHTSATFHENETTKIEEVLSSDDDE